jgi:hypothetical protein
MSGWRSSLARWTGGLGCGQSGGHPQVQGPHKPLRECWRCAGDLHVAGHRALSCSSVLISSSFGSSQRGVGCWTDDVVLGARGTLLQSGSGQEGSWEQARQGPVSPLREDP